MDWKLIAATFGIVFLAELGDKTWMAILAASAARPAPLSILLGALPGFLCAILLAMALGAGLGMTLPERMVRIAAGTLFLLVGLWFLLRA